MLNCLLWVIKLRILWAIKPTKKEVRLGMLWVYLKSLLIN